MRLLAKTIRVEKNDNVKKEDRHGQFNFHGKATQNEAFPVLKLYYNPAQSARTQNEAFPVLKLYHNAAQSSQDPKRGISSTKVVLQPSTIQPGPKTRHFQY